MTVDIVKHIAITLTDEERKTLEKTNDFLRELMKVMKDNKCEQVEYDEGWGDCGCIPIAEIDDIDTRIENFLNLTEMY